LDNIYIGKVLNGDVDAFGYFVSTYKDFAFSLAYSILKNSYQAEESVQESFIRAFDKLHTFRREAWFKTWFGRIIINESLRRIKNERIYAKADEIQELEISDIDDSLKALLDEERRYFITRVFELLSHEESLVLELYYLKEFSVKEICFMTGWSLSKVKMLNLRGRKSFYSKLSGILKSEKKKIL